MDKPSYKLIQFIQGQTPCISHKVESIEDLYNTPTWQMDIVDIDKTKFECMLCSECRVYKIIPEKTLLNKN